MICGDGLQRMLMHTILDFLLCPEGLWLKLLWSIYNYKQLCGDQMMTNIKNSKVITSRDPRGSSSHLHLLSNCCCCSRQNLTPIWWNSKLFLKKVVSFTILLKFILIVNSRLFFPSIPGAGKGITIGRICFYFILSHLSSINQCEMLSTREKKNTVSLMRSFISQSEHWKITRHREH